jgi:hypothetical protein
VLLRNYPRWSSSLWDLSARALTRALYRVPDNQQDPDPQEQVPAAQHVATKRAFAESMCAVIQHMPNSGAAVRQIAAMHIEEHKSKRCMYRVRIEEDLQPTRQTDYFKFAPSFLRPAELVLRAALFSMSGSIDIFPPRPPLQLPRDKVIDGKRFIAIHQLKEPARSGLLRWLYRHRRAPVAQAGAPEGLALWAIFEDFLKHAV